MQRHCNATARQRGLRGRLDLESHARQTQRAERRQRVKRVKSEMPRESRSPQISPRPSQSRSVLLYFSLWVGYAYGYAAFFHSRVIH